MFHHIVLNRLPNSVHIEGTAPVKVGPTQRYLDTLVCSFCTLEFGKMSKLAVNGNVDEIFARAGSRAGAATPGPIISYVTF